MKTRIRINTIQMATIVVVLVILTGLFAIIKSTFFYDDKEVVKTVDDQITKELMLDDNQKPYISIIPQSDGHRLDLKITNIPDSVVQIEYDLIYVAKDGDFEIEKGIGGTVEIDKNSFERELLLGTESCTNGCKYKYDEGITGGTLILNLITSDNRSSFFEAPFVFNSSTTVKSNGGLILDSEEFEIKASIDSNNEYFVLVKNYQPVYSVFSSGKGTGKVTSITPETVTKEDLTLVTGDYIIE